jgi:DNA polymerase/3'-5' exonuclease PolX
LFHSIPGISTTLAQRIHDTLNVDTLEALEAAAHQGHLEKVKGIGPRRAESLRATLANMLGRVRSRKTSVIRAPNVDLLLDVDEEYREKSQAGDLPTIAPGDSIRRTSLGFLFCCARGEWHFTAHTPSASAHQLGRTRDWVSLFLRRRPP